MPFRCTRLHRNPIYVFRGRGADWNLKRWYGFGPFSIDFFHDFSIERSDFHGALYFARNDAIRQESKIDNMSRLGIAHLINNIHTNILSFNSIANNTNHHGNQDQGLL